MRTYTQNYAFFLQKRKQHVETLHRWAKSGPVLRREYDVQRKLLRIACDVTHFKTIKTNETCLIYDARCDVIAEQLLILRRDIVLDGEISYASKVKLDALTAQIGRLTNAGLSDVNVDVDAQIWADIATGQYVKWTATSRGLAERDSPGYILRNVWRDLHVYRSDCRCLQCRAGARV